MDNERAGYLLCYCNVKFNRFGIQAPMKHAGYSKHEKVSNVRISSTPFHINVEPNRIVENLYWVTKR